MSRHERTTTVGQLPSPTSQDTRLPGVLTALVWLLWVGSLGVLAARLSGGGPWSLAGLVTVDGLTVVLWSTATFFSGVVHSYARRYMSGDPHVDRFFGLVFVFTLSVLVLVAADSLLLFWAAWLGMGLVMAELIGHADGWPQARAAASLARRYFLLGGGLLGLALALLWQHTGATTVSGVVPALGTAAPPSVLVAAGALLLAAMVQSALLPFQTWLLSSMTAPTPASALMHAGFVNAGGILLVRFAPVVTVDTRVMLAAVVVGAASALTGKILKSVQVDVKTRLGCSTVGQMGFMIMQAGLGFFSAALTHLVLHGFYKAYLFLAAGTAVEQTSPTDVAHGHGRGTAGVGVVGAVVTAATALAGGIVFAVLTGKGTSVDGGLLLTGLVVLTTMHAARTALGRRAPPAAYRYGVLPLVVVPAVAVYGVVYTAITGLLSGLPVVTAPVELTVVHGVVAVAFLVAYVAVETGRYRRSDRLYVALVNAGRPPSETLLTATEEYDEH